MMPHLDTYEATVDSAPAGAAATCAALPRESTGQITYTMPSIRIYEKIMIKE